MTKQDGETILQPGEANNAADWFGCHLRECKNYFRFEYHRLSSSRLNTGEDLPRLKRRWSPGGAHDHGLLWCYLDAGDA